MRIARLALGVLIVTLVCATSAEATFPGANGRIAYECGREICITNAERSFKKRLTEPARKRRFRFTPSFSPDGNRIVFAGEAREGRLELYLVRSNGTGFRRLTHSPRRTHNSEPQFTADGRGVIFFRKGGVFNLDLATRLITRIGPGLGPRTYGAAVSPDGTRIAFMKFLGAPIAHPQIWVRAIDGSSEAPVTLDDEDVHAREPDWTPDGERIVYSHAGPTQPGGGNEYGIFLIKPDGGELTRVTPTSIPVYGSPVISPDGQRLALLVKARCDPADGCDRFIAVHDIGSDDYTLLRRVEPGTNPNWGPRP